MTFDRPCRPSFPSFTLRRIDTFALGAFPCQSSRSSDDIPAQRTPHPNHTPHHSIAGFAFLLATSVAFCDVRLDALVLKALPSTPLCLSFMIPIADVNIGGPARS